METKKIKKIARINVIPNEDVYDISVAKNNNFIANKTLIHNCGEIPLSAYDSCRLMVINLFGFVKNPFTVNAYFDYKDFYEHAKILQRLMDNMVDLEIECIEKIIQKIISDPEPEEIKSRELNLWNKILDTCKKGRRTGSGITALGDTLAALNIPYGSEEGIQETEKIYKILKFGAYRSSVDMAKELGSFPVYEYELEKNNSYLNRFNEETILDNTISGKELYDDMKKYGRRNIALLTTAPVGTISLLSKLKDLFGTTSGIEPLYSDMPYTRKKKGNPGDKDFRSDSVDQNGDHWMHYLVYPSGIQEWMKIANNSDIKKSPWYNNCAEQLNWKNRVRLQAAAQKHVDHSISSTINLPNNATVEDVATIYETAWKYGCKGITVYRDGCRTGVLVKEDKKDEILTKTTAPKRPKDLNCDIHHVKSRGQDFFVVVGLFNGEPYEVFAGLNGQVSHCKQGILTKLKRGHYRLTTKDGKTLENICDLLTDEQAVIARMISLSLRHGSEIQFIVDQIEKSPGDMSNFGKAIARVLKKYISDGTKVVGQECGNCGSSALIRQEGCITCSSCGNSKCG